MGNNSVPKFIFRLSRFPVYRGSVLGRFIVVAFCSFVNAPKTNGDFKHCQDISADFESQGEGTCRF